MTVRAFAPGRVEIAGNHVDHQNGIAIAATTERGIALELRPNGIGAARVRSEGFEPMEVSLESNDPDPDEVGLTEGIVRGVCAGLRSRGIDIGGFDAAVSSTLAPGRGLSSSAAFELALGCALDLQFGSGSTPPADLATIARDAERDYFGKPCGLLDQASIITGGICVLDFASGGMPSVSPLPFDFGSHGLELFLVDTGCDHSRYSSEYAQVALDMADVARFYGVDALRSLDEDTFLAHLSGARSALGDRAVLRTLHFFKEMRLVAQRKEALMEGDTDAFLEATRQSGSSSACYLQNVSAFGTVDQPAMVALALVDWALGGTGACRIHGGGFGGTIQAFVPSAESERFEKRIEHVLGRGSCLHIRLSSEGASATWA